MESLAPPLIAWYFVVTTIFCLYGLHRVRIVLAARRPLPPPAPPERSADASLPIVTIQLPMFEEPHVAERVIRAAAALDWPRDRLEVQVLDDSAGPAAARVDEVVERLRDSGLDVAVLRRRNREGYKAGALAAGLRSARGDFVALFDADFVPPPDFLRRLMPEFAEAEVGMVQARWAHLNRDASLLTRLQALCLDGHFLLEQHARAATGCWFNFNGTAGIWRRRCIDEAGGWQHDTLTEDTDLSYRAQLAGWTFRYRPDVAVPAELPPTFAGLAGQQHRWTKGLVQTAIKLLPAILRAPGPWRRRVEAWFHLTSPLPVAALFLLTLLAPLTLLTGLPDRPGPAMLLAAGLAALVVGSGGTALFLVTAGRAAGRSWRECLFFVPATMALGVGLGPTCMRAILEALLRPTGSFVRTPKQGDAPAAPAVGASRRIPRGAVDLALAAAMLGTLAATLVRPERLVGLPFVALFAWGYLYALTARWRDRSTLRPRAGA